MKLLGLGRNQLQPLPQSGMRIDIEAMDDTLGALRRSGQSVLMAVAVLGTTEYGTVDPVDGVLAARDRSSAEGLGFSVHVDAAWGGYLATLFRNPDGSLRSRQGVASEFASFPAPFVHDAFAALGGTDSCTVDPHKMGYLPYGAGAFICRDNRVMTLLAEQADYVFHGGTHDDYLEHYRSLGQYIPEGSKPGAMAAAAYVTHKVLPLDSSNFGRLPAQTILSAEAFLATARKFAEQIAPFATVTVPFAPDSNLVCIGLNPAGNQSLAQANQFVCRLHDDMRCDPSQPLQLKEFFASATTLRSDAMGDVAMKDILRSLAIDPYSSESDGDNRLFILRHTLMNPYLLDKENGISYIQRYFDYLGQRIRLLLSATTST